MTFVKVDFDGTGIEEIGDVKKRLRFTTWDIYPGSDTFPVSLKYTIIKLKEDSEKATVKVMHEYLGDVGLDFLEIERKTKDIIYHLKKDKGLWKITFPSHASYVSVSTAIRILEWGIETYKQDAERVKKMERNINILKKYL